MTPNLAQSLLQSLIGGMVIGLAAGLFWLLNGRVAGISGLAAGLITRHWQGRTLENLLFLAGLPVGVLIYRAELGAPPFVLTEQPVVLVVGGVLVGLGTATAGGCTSGHGVCGLARLSPRSMVATATFMLVAMITVFVARHVLP